MRRANTGERRDTRKIAGKMRRKCLNCGYRFDEHSGPLSLADLAKCPRYNHKKRDAA